jgi:hypothetical protein
VRQMPCREKCARLPAPELPALPLPTGVDLIDSISIYAVKSCSQANSSRSKKRPGTRPGFFKLTTLLRVVMRVVVTVMTLRVRGNNRNG